MNCLPIVNRELRVAARKRSTFWLRVAAAVTALVVGSGCMILSRVHGARTTSMGSVLFYVLTWLSLAAGLSAGLFFTSDCLSEEKREGTLGLLFLTDLRGYDVALGKLLATSLRGFFALLAVLPILAITLLMGGVTGAQYWKTALALVNALFFSLATGMAVSALSRDSQKALTATLLVLLLFALGGPIADARIASAKQSGFEPHWSLSSPGYVLAVAGAWSGLKYWSALVTTHLLGWAMLALACVLVPHTWQERKKAGAGHTRGWAYAWKYGGARRRRRLRRQLIGRQPVAWLACRERWQSLTLWVLALLALGGFLYVLHGKTPQEGWIVWNWIGKLFIWILYLWAASQACRFLVEARRCGLLELLLATPLNERQIVAGQWRALLRLFALPVLLLLSVHIAATALSQLAFQSVVTQAASVTSSMVTNQNGTVSSTTVVVSPTGKSSRAARTSAGPSSGRVRLASSGRQVAVAVVATAATALSTAADLLALGWFGMWMGMTSRTANLATLKTILFVQVIPWFVIVFGTSMAVGLLMSGFLLRARSPQPAAWLTWWPLLSTVLGAALALAKDVGFIVWSRNKLHRSFREQAARGVGQPRFVAPRPLATVMVAPPVIAAK